VTSTEDGPSTLSFPAFPSVKEYIAPVTYDICVSPESVLRRQTKNPINDPITIVAAKPPNTPPINAPLVLVLLAVDCPGKVGVVVRGSIGTATAVVGGLIGASVGDKVGNSDELVFIITVRYRSQIISDYGDI
jgi:hypothetical protein